MSPTRNNTLVLDTSVLPKRPKVSDVKNFMDNKLKLDMTLVKRIQLHNLKNVVRLGMVSLEVAEQVASIHHLKHFMEYEGTQVTVPVPIYVESAAVDVRVFDLSEDIKDETLKKFFSKYGEVISIHDDVWRNFFPGFSNGVKVLKIMLALPIPSIVTVEGEASLVEYKNQPKAVKPKPPATIIKASNQQQPSTVIKQKPATSIQTTDQQQPQSVSNETQWPSLSPSPEEASTSNKQQLDNKAEAPKDKRQRLDCETHKKNCQPHTDKKISQPHTDDNINSVAAKLKRIIERLEAEGLHDDIYDRTLRSKCILKRARELLRYEKDL